MSLPLVFRPEVQEDLDEAWAWYEKQRAGLGDEFLEEVRATLHRITEAPTLYAEVYRGARRALTARFPYAVFFREEEARILVLAIVHGHRRPSIWQRRA